MDNNITKIKTHHMNTYGYTYNVLNHKKHKKELLKIIANVPLKPLKEGNDNIAHTDWYLPKETRREYFKYFFKNILTDYAEEFCKLLKVKKCTVRNYWFQQYKKNNYHGWHVHDAHFSAIYYIELPDKNMRTEFKDSVTGKIESINVKEGDIFTFPGHLRHRSKLFNSKKRKTVIVFNLTYSDDGPQDDT
tara:strand:+ start:102 stop:671 length:570 start_codon:yes stop_codon:yes gene_type:complete